MPNQMEVVKKKRAAAKCWMTRSIKELQELLDDNSTSQELLEAAVSDFDKRLSSLDDQQAQFELELEDFSKLEADIEEADKFRRSTRKVRAEAAKRLKTDSDESDSVSTSSKDKTEVKSPRLELPKFSGELTDWQSFWDRFEALVNQE